MKIRLGLPVAALLTVLAVSVSAAAVARGLPAKPTWFDDPIHESGTEVPGAYVVQQRGYFSITAQMHLRSLTPGHQYSLWWVIYNDPTACTDGCGPDDLMAAVTTGQNPAGIGVHFGGSYVAPVSGKLDVGTRILENSANGCQNGPPFSTLCNSVIDASIAEATILINDHGPAGTGALGDVADAFGSGCKTYNQFGTVIASYGETGFDCFTPQVVHLP